VATYHITNLSNRSVKMPGSSNIFLGARGTLCIKTSSFSLSLAKLNKLLTVQRIMAVQPGAKTIESSEPVIELTKQKRVRRKITPEQTPKISGKVSTHG
jgi:hypothetical protein